MTRQLLVLRERNHQLERDLGQIVVANPNKSYVRQLWPLDDLTWQFRIYLPSSRQYRLCRSFGGRRSDWSFSPRSEQFTMTIGLRQSVNGHWYLRHTFPTGGGSRIVDADLVKRIIRRPPATWEVRDRLVEFNSDQDVELLRLLDGDLRVWLRPYTPHRVTREVEPITAR